MATHRAVHVRGIRHGERRIVTVGDDPTPIADRATRAAAETEARVHAETLGYRYVVVHELDGEESILETPEPVLQPPYPSGAKGPPAG